MPTDTGRGDLALFGGSPAKSAPYGQGRRFDHAEEEAAVAAIRSQKLWYKQGGTRVAAAEQTICEMWNTGHAICCSSGTAAVHTALVMCGVEKGDEVIVNPVSDWGSVAGILALGAIPIFCDIDEETYSLDPTKVEKAITGKTRAILVVHLAGYPARIREIMKTARACGIRVIEDCAQSPLAHISGKMLGTFGDAGAFSVNDSKHISCGEGGFVITDDHEMSAIGRLFIDKAYQRNRERGTVDVTFLGFNYRLSELSAAVLRVQLGKLPEQIRKRRAYAEALISRLEGIEAYRSLKVQEEAGGVYWFILGQLELGRFSTDRAGIVKALNAEGIPVWPALAPARTLYSVTALKDGTLYACNRSGPAEFLQNQPYNDGFCPVAERISDSVLQLFCSEFFSERDAEETALGLRKVLSHYHR